MRWFPWALVLFFLATPALAAEPKEWDVIRVMAGGQLDFKTPTTVQRVAVGDASIADVSVLGKRNLLVLGKKTGVTTLLLWQKKTDQPRMYRIQVDQAVPGKTPVTGAAAHLTAEGAPVIVHGEMQDALHHQMALRMAEQAVGEKGAVIDRSTIPLSGQVMVDVRFVELSKKVLKEAGINLITHPNHNISFGVFSPGSLTSISKPATTSPGGAVDIPTGFSVPMLNALHLVLGSTTNSALGLLSLLEENGLARTLAQPSMTVVSGQTASFMAGGEYPIPVAQSLGQVTITYKPYGIRLALTPTVFSKDRIAIKLAPEVSELDFTNTVTLAGLSVPGVLTRRAETTIELGDGESFVIAGLISRTFVDAVDKVPGLGDVPVLGAFFKSTRFTREDKELVIIATPKLVRPIAAKAEVPPLPGAEYDQYNPSVMKRLFYGGYAPDEESVGLSQ
ncbi:MAG TPA: type II and III secretion system protein family protein [Gallionella sp.]|nr:type II and III secretion system protein family protein [Gallionella sp.]